MDQRSIEFGERNRSCRRYSRCNIGQDEKEENFSPTLAVHPKITTTCRWPNEQDAVRCMRFASVRKRRVTVRGQQVTEQDWRGILAVLVTAGYFLTVAIASLKLDFVQLLAMTGFWSSPELLILNWYFEAKEERV